MEVLFLVGENSTRKFLQNPHIFDFLAAESLVQSFEEKLFKYLVLVSWLVVLEAVQVYPNVWKSWGAQNMRFWGFKGSQHTF